MTLREAAETILLAAAVLAAVRFWVVRPIMEAVRESLSMARRITAAVERVERDLAVNGSEYDLPEEDRGKPLRTIVVRTRRDTQCIKDAVEKHRNWANSVIRLENARREEERKPLLPTEDD